MKLGPLLVVPYSMLVLTPWEHDLMIPFSTERVMEVTQLVI